MRDPSTLTLTAGVGDGEHTACLMSARSLLDGRGLSDGHPSRVIRIALLLELCEMGRPR